MDDRFDRTYAVLLAGGTGSRLWPVSRERFPKQLVRFIGDDSLVQATVQRVAPLIDSARIRVVCGQEHHFEIARHIEALGIAAEGRILREPCGRNTAPAILLALLAIRRERPDALVCVFPADHVIRDREDFRRQVAAAVALAAEGHIVTFGIRPHYPETGYGYIEGGRSLGRGARRIRRFVEKPDLATAQRYLDAGNFFWNSGMFAFAAQTMADEFRRHQPALYRDLERLLAEGPTLSAADYGRLPDISIDYAIMEHTDRGAVLPSDFGWSDIGSWKSLYDFLAKDADGNVVDGDVLTAATRDCFIVGRERLIATNRIRHLAVIDTPDAVFVSDLETSRDVKTIVRMLKESGRREYHQHRTVRNAWGACTVLAQAPTHEVTRLEIHPGADHRFVAPAGSRLHLTVAAGRLHWRCGGREGEIAAGDNLPLTGAEPLRLENRGETPLELICVSLPPPAAAD